MNYDENNEMLERLEALLDQRNYNQAGALVKDMNPADAAFLLEELSEQKMPVFFRLLPK